MRIEDGSIHVPVRPICDPLGVDWAGQRRRINRGTVLSEEMQAVDVAAMVQNRASRPPGRDTKAALGQSISSQGRSSQGRGNVLTLRQHVGY